jgi:predicted DNA-binding protein (MmcQ/YjbR family)
MRPETWRARQVRRSAERTLGGAFRSTSGATCRQNGVIMAVQKKTMKAAKKPAAKTVTTKKASAKTVAKKTATKAGAKKSSSWSAPHPPRMDGPAGVLERYRAICLALPESTEVEAWGHPTFRVKDKIFASVGGENGVWTFGMKTTHEMQAGLVMSDPRFSIAAYVGKHGWIHMRVEDPIDWNEVRALVVGSYRMIAPKTLAARALD